MTTNKNGIPINRRESIIKTKNVTEEDAIYEFSLPPGFIRMYSLGAQIPDALAIVESFRQDHLYVTFENVIKVDRQIKQICGSSFKYSYEIIAQMGA